MHEREKGTRREGMKAIQHHLPTATLNYGSYYSCHDEGRYGMPGDRVCMHTRFQKLAKRPTTPLCMPLSIKKRAVLR